LRRLPKSAVSAGNLFHYIDNCLYIDQLEKPRAYNVLHQEPTHMQQITK